MKRRENKRRLGLKAAKREKKVEEEEENFNCRKGAFTPMRVRVFAKNCSLMKLLLSLFSTRCDC